MDYFQQLFGGNKIADIKEIIEQGAFLVDVRTPGEFETGHVKDSVNIPVDTIVSQLSAFKNKNNIVVFCRSGSRSAMAKSILELHGFTNVVNGGTWDYVNQFVQ
jgi:phage shock protein E